MSSSIFPDHRTDSDLDAICREFDAEAACIDHLFQSRWPDGFRCPACGHARAYPIRSRRLPLYQCEACRRQTSLISGTIMEGSRTPLHKWLIAIRLLSRESGVTAVRLSALIRVTYKTAWLILHKIRCAISAFDASRPLTGNIQAGLRFYDRLASIRRPRSFPFIVFGSLSGNGTPVQLKMKIAPTRNRQPDMARHTLRAFCARHASASGNEPGTFNESGTLPRQGGGMGAMGARHAYASGNEPWQWSGRIAKTLNAQFWQAVGWINLTFNGLGSRHMQLYWDEFCYRRNLALRNVDAFAHLSGLCMRREELIQQSV